MRNNIFVIISVTILLSSLFCSAKSDNDSIKTGLNIGLLPTITYDSDFGLQYGGLINLFFFGDGTTYPEYLHSLYFEISRFTKGSAINRFSYDSKYLIPHIRLTSDVSYLTEDALPFFGFNGAKSIYNSSWENHESPDYLSKLFYRHSRKMFRLKADFQGKFTNKNWGWIVGFLGYNISIDTVDITKLNKGRSDNDKIPDVNGLYQKYIDWGIIKKDEKNGGHHQYLKLGITYDTRDNEPNPMKGIWSEFVVQSAPSFFGNNSFPHAKISFTYRQYFTLVKNQLSLAYRFKTQSTIGDCPFYLYPLITTSFLKGANNEGLGGGKTIRGAMRNRIVGKSIAYSNIELRWKFAYFRLFNQNFYSGLNLFLDAGKIIQDINFDESKAIENAQAINTSFNKNDYFTSKEVLHIGIGSGGRLAMNQNFIIACDVANSYYKQDGGLGIYIGLNYLF